MDEPRWSHDGVAVTVLPGSGSTLMAGVPVLVSVGMIGVAMASSLAVMVVPGLESSASTGLAALLALGSPAPLWLTARLSGPVPVVATYAGLQIGRQHYPRERILGADHRDGAVHLLLDDGRIIRTPPLADAVGRAIQTAFAKPGDLFATTRAERALADVRSAG
ncbi:MAG: hypothetical protein H6737_00805 [Alphaproteobacteria bacterium]|nr:hypothetical protein [Alphaproteobacteria bacterium]